MNNDDIFCNATGKDDEDNLEWTCHHDREEESTLCTMHQSQDDKGEEYTFPFGPLMPIIKWSADDIADAVQCGNKPVLAKLLTEIVDAINLQERIYNEDVSKSIRKQESLQKVLDSVYERIYDIEEQLESVQ